MLANIFLPARDSRLPEEYRLRSGVACSLGLFTEQERCMAKIAIRFLILSMFTTSLLVTSVVAPVDAATTSSKHVNKKRVRLTHQTPKAADPYASPFSSKYDEDFDRRNAGGGGGY
jgi:hypothetical protein